MRDQRNRDTVGKKEKEDELGRGTEEKVQLFLNLTLAHNQEWRRGAEE